MQLLFAVVVFYFILGMFMETLPMIVATVPIIAPIMFKAGFDPVWFGVLIIILMELAIAAGRHQSLCGPGPAPARKIDDVIIGAAPFVITC